MLQAMRDKVMGGLGWFIIGLIIITFALFGLGSYLQDKSQAYAAVVNDVEITNRELQQVYQQQRAQMEQMMGDAFNPALIDEKMLKQRALNALIQKQLLLQEAQAEGMSISDQLLAARIHAIPALQVEGKFSEQRYKDLLAQTGRVTAGFEMALRQDMQIEQLLAGLSQTTFVTRAELERSYGLQEQKRDLSYLVVASEPLQKNVEVGGDQVEAYYSQHSEEFVAPERVRLAYLRLSGEGLSSDLEIEEDKLLAYYEERKQALLTREQRRASHVLIQVAADADEDAVNKAETKAADVLKQIQAGGDFAELAGKYSDDPGSSAQGGDLGFFARGAMVAEFEDAVFNQQVGDVSEPVKTQFGFHVIKLVEIRGSEIPELDQVRAELVDELKQREADELFYEQLELLTDVSYENPDSLDAAAEALGMEVQTTDWITAGGGSGIAEYPKVLAGAFSDDVLEAGNNSEPIEVGRNDAIVLRVEEREAARPEPLETVKESIVATLKQKLAAEKAAEEGKALLQKLEQGATLESLNDQDYMTFQKAEGVIRSAPGYNPEVLREVFRMTRPADGEHRDKGFQLSNGDYAIMRLTRVSDPDPAAISEQARIQLERGYETMRRSLVQSALVEGLRARAVITIPQEPQQ